MNTHRVPRNGCQAGVGGGIVTRLPTVSMHGMPRKGCQTGAGGCIVTQLPTDWSCP